MPEPINTAPKDGTPILTDEGIVKYINPRHWGCPMTEGWVCCQPDGTLFECREDGKFYVTPKIWTPMPDWIR